MIKNEKSLIDRAKNYAVKNDITVNDVLILCLKEC